MENLKSEIKKIAKACGADLVGIARADKGAKEIFKPCQSMIVLAARLLDGIVYNIKSSPVQYTCIHRYTHVFLNDIGFSVAKFIEGKGHKAICVFSRGALGLRKEEGFLGRRVLRYLMGYGIIDRLVEEHFHEPISFVQAAEEAGLGLRGNCNLLITQAYGVRVELGVVLTDCFLEPDDKIVRDFCQPQKCNFRCVHSCPVGAITKEGVVKGVRCFKHTLSLQQKGIKEMECGLCVAACPAQIEWRL